MCVGQPGPGLGRDETHGQHGSPHRHAAATRRQPADSRRQPTAADRPSPTHPPDPQGIEDLGGAPVLHQQLTNDHVLALVLEYEPYETEAAFETSKDTIADPAAPRRRKGKVSGCGVHSPAGQRGTAVPRPCYDSPHVSPCCHPRRRASRLRRGWRRCLRLPAGANCQQSSCFDLLDLLPPLAAPLLFAGNASLPSHAGGPQPG